MAITYVNKGEVANGNTSTTDIVVPKYTGCANGDLMFLVVSIPGNRTVTTPSGWTLQPGMPVTADATSAGSKIYVFIRVASSEPASYTVSMDVAAANACGSWIGFTGADQNTTLHTHNEATEAVANTSAAAPSVSPTITDGLLVCVWGFSQGRSATMPGGTTERVDIVQDLAPLGTARTHVIGTEQLSASGATGTRTATTNGSCTDSMVSYVVAPGVTTYSVAAGDGWGMPI